MSFRADFRLFLAVLFTLTLNACQPPNPPEPEAPAPQPWIEEIDTQQILMETTLELDISAGSSAADASITYAVSHDNPDLGDISINDNQQIVYTAHAEAGIDIVTVQVTDSRHHLSNSTSFTVHTYTNAAPTLEAIEPQKISFYQRVQFTLQGQSENNSHLTYQVSDSTLGKIYINGNVLTYRANNKVGSETITITATDPVNQQSITTDFQVQIYTDKTPKIEYIGDKKAILGQPFELTLEGHSYNNSDLTYQVSDSTLGKVSIVKDKFTYTAQKVGIETITITATDSVNQKSTTTDFQVLTYSDKSPTLAAIGNKRVILSNSFELILDGQSHNNRNLIYQASNSTLGHIHIKDNVLTYNASSYKVGRETITITATDPVNQQSTTTQLQVENYSIQPPRLYGIDHHQKVILKQSLELTLQGSSYNQSPLIYEASESTLGKISIDGNVLTFTANDQLGTEAITITATDPVNQQSVTTELKVQTISDKAPELPTIKNHKQASDDSKYIIFKPRSYNGNHLLYSFSKTDLGTIWQYWDEIRIKSSDRHIGTDSITVTVTDPLNNRSSSTTFQLEVYSGKAPTIVDIDDQTIEINGQLDIPLHGTAFNKNALRYTYGCRSRQSQSLDDYAYSPESCGYNSISISENNVLTYRIDSNEAKVKYIQVTAHDDVNERSSSTEFRVSPSLNGTMLTQSSVTVPLPFKTDSGFIYKVSNNTDLGRIAVLSNRLNSKEVALKYKTGENTGVDIVTLTMIDPVLKTSSTHQFYMEIIRGGHRSIKRPLLSNLTSIHPIRQPFISDDVEYDATDIAEHIDLEKVTSQLPVVDQIPDQVVPLQGEIAIDIPVQGKAPNASLKYSVTTSVPDPTSVSLNDKQQIVVKATEQPSIATINLTVLDVNNYVLTTQSFNVTTYTQDTPQLGEMRLKPMRPGYVQYRGLPINKNHIENLKYEISNNTKYGKVKIFRYTGKINLRYESTSLGQDTVMIKVINTVTKKSTMQKIRVSIDPNTPYGYSSFIRTIKADRAYCLPSNGCYGRGSASYYTSGRGPDKNIAQVVPFVQEPIPVIATIPEQKIRIQDPVIIDNIFHSEAAHAALKYEISKHAGVEATINAQKQLVLKGLEVGTYFLNLTVTDTFNLLSSHRRIKVQVYSDKAPILSMIEPQTIFKGGYVTIPFSGGKSFNKENLMYQASSEKHLGSVLLSGRSIIYSKSTQVGIDRITVTAMDPVNRKKTTQTFPMLVYEKSNLVEQTEFESATKVIQGQIISPFNAKVGEAVHFTYTVDPKHVTPKTFGSDDYTLKLDASGAFTFTSHLNYLGSVEIPLVVTNDFNEEERFKVTFNTEITSVPAADRLSSMQWHLNNTGQKNDSEQAGTPGHDINIGLLHRQGVKGQDVGVALMDGHIDVYHRDLSRNMVVDQSYDYADNDTDISPTPSSVDGHGTMVAGILGAEANRVGGLGVAPKVRMRGFYYKSHQALEAQQDIYQNRLDGVLIVNKAAAGYRLNSKELYRNELQASLDATRSLNQGRGVLHFLGAPNGFEAFKYVGYAYSKNKRSTNINLPAVNAQTDDESVLFTNTVVAAVIADANQPHAPYSSSGSNVFIAAPGGSPAGYRYPGMVTLTQRNRGQGHLTSVHERNYVNNASGTSMAAPVAAGVAALMYEVNPQLTWRDVRHIMARTAEKIDAKTEPVVFTRDETSSFVAQDGWITNAAGFHFHNYYGFGMIDTTRAVQMAANGYKLLPELMTTSWQAPQRPQPLTIPENLTGVTQKIAMAEPLRVEAIQLKISIDHARASDLAIVLTSPSGTRSVMMTPRSLLGLKMDTEGFDETILLSHAFYGESAMGAWQVQVVDTNQELFHYVMARIESDVENNRELGTLKAVELRVLGHSPSADKP